MRKFIIIFITAFFCLSSYSTAFAHEYAMSYLYGGTSVQYETYVKNTGSVLDNICPDYFELDANGNLKVQKLDRSFINNMQAKGISVTPFLSNHWDRQLGITALKNGSNLATQIAKSVNDNGLDGVNIDIENVTHEQKADYTDFIKALRAKLPNKTISVAVAANPNNWQTGWHGSYDYTELAKYSDYLMVMCYDESYSGGPSGPIASSSFTERSIQYALSKTTANKIVLGMPFFGRYWKQGAAVGGNGITNMDVENLMKNYTAAKNYVASTQSAKVMLTIKDSDVKPKIWGGTILSAGTYEIWYNDLAATENTLKLVEKHGLRGSGSWAMGQEDLHVWPMYAKYKSKTTTPTNPPTTVPTKPQTTAPKPAVVTGISVAPTSVTIAVNKTKQLTATVIPANAANKGVTWKTGNKKIATVTSKGLVKGIKPGVVNIVVQAKSSGKTATSKVTVVVPVSKVSITPSTAIIVKQNKTKQLRAVITPSNASNKGVTWSSSNTRIAIVTYTGTVKGIRKGKASITVKSKDGGKISKRVVTII